MLAEFYGFFYLEFLCEQRELNYFFEALEMLIEGLRFAEKVINSEVGSKNGMNCNKEIQSGFFLL